jgi:hypothetical protein
MTLEEQENIRNALLMWLPFIGVAGGDKIGRRA